MTLSGCKYWLLSKRGVKMSEECLITSPVSLAVEDCRDNDRLGAAYL